jgi:hypothetical protein
LHIFWVKEIQEFNISGKTGIEMKNPPDFYPEAFIAIFFILSHLGDKMREVVRRGIEPD